jgi:nucleoside 2-deoxyribosyltransferase
LKAYISISYENRQILNDELITIASCLNSYKIESHIFVDKYKFSKDQECVMMKQAFADIDSSDILIAETSAKAIGVGIEAGYAKAKNKIVIYLRNNIAEHSTTLSGLSDYRIIYNDAKDLKIKLDQVLNKL